LSPLRVFAPEFEIVQFMDRKKAWNGAFENYIRSLDAQKPVIWLGDLNVAPTALGIDMVSFCAISKSISKPLPDIKRSKQNYNKSAGHTEIEITAFNQTLNPSPSLAGSERLVDVWREMHPTDQHYTYFSYRFDCRTKGIGWRLDYCLSISAKSCVFAQNLFVIVVLSQRLLPRVKMCEIR
jgi:AP endonuclease-1